MASSRPQSFRHFITATLIGGLFFLLPLAVIIMIGGKVVLTFQRLLAPFIKILPAALSQFPFLSEILAVLIPLLICMTAGLIARSHLGTWFSVKLEKVLQEKMPMYGLLKGTLSAVSGFNSPGSETAVALAHFDDNTVLAFIIERHQDDMMTVFVPSSPTPLAGSVFFLPSARVQILDIPVSKAVRCIMQFGAGAKDLLVNQTVKT